jgi:zinc D-Ala-D-Ala dipeptidase
MSRRRPELRAQATQSSAAHQFCCILSRMRRLLWIALLCSSMVAAQTAAQPQFFHITPVRPVEELRREALKAQPPVEHREFLQPDLVELVKLDPTIKLDIRYATSRNFLSTPVYEEARAFMQRPAAEAVARASQKLHAKGFGLLIHDAYRPWYVTKIFWDATPPEDHKFVADPAEGSRHNRGCAVDLTLYDLKTGEAVPMTGLYDEMSERSYPNYKGGTEEERRNRDTLRAAMEAEGFTVYEYEWWHFDYKGYEKYPIMNIPFEKLGTLGDSHAAGRSQSSAPGTLLFRDDERNRAPRAISTPAPTPTSNHYSGVVVVQTLVDETGNVAHATVKRSAGAEADQNALDAVRKWKFMPAMRNGIPIPVEVTVEINFRS